MAKESGVLFLFALANEIKLSYECPIILLTQKEYADSLCNFLISMHTTLQECAPTEAVLDIVNNFHFEWLQAVQDVEILQKRAKETPREYVLMSIDYTMECIKNRHKYLQQYINHLNKTSSMEKAKMRNEIEIINDMRKIYGSALLEKQKYLNNTADKKEFTTLVLDEIKELFNWLDLLFNNLALQLCTLLQLPKLPAQLSETLQQVIDNMACFISPNGKITAASKRDSTLPPESRTISMFKDSDTNKIIEKIKILEDRIYHLKAEKSSPGTMAQQHKAIFLQDRLESLENLKLSLSFLKNKDYCRKAIKKGVNEENEVFIFNHLLPHQARCQLVEKLIRLWETAIGDPEIKSLVSLMRPTEIKEVFEDSLGHFTVDKFGRNLYSKKGDHQVYQLDETNMLVPLSDDEHHVYFYDECGRYYLNETKVRVYKAHHSASEFMLYRNGMLVKTSEMVDGVKYHFDELGRYTFDSIGDKIYSTHGSTEKYCSDGLGNLVLIRDSEQAYFKTCPVEPMAIEDNFYLKRTIGEALKTCVAEVVLALPQDPIQYLADRLTKYHFNMEAKEKRRLEQEQIMSERELLKPYETPQSEQLVEPEESFEDRSGVDLNFINY